MAGGLQQTALNIGPIVGIAAATALMALGSHSAATGGSGAAASSAMGPTLTVLAAVAAVGAFLAIGLPGRTTGAVSPRPRTTA